MNVKKLKDLFVGYWIAVFVFICGTYEASKDKDIHIGILSWPLIIIFSFIVPIYQYLKDHTSSEGGDEVR